MEDIKSMAKSNAVPRIVCISVGAVLYVTLLLSALLSSIHTGHLITLVSGTVLILLGAFYKKIPMLPRSALLVLIVCAFLCISVLVIFGSFDNVSYNEDALIVLGAGINGEVPTEKLTRRLDSAVRYYKTNHDAVIVVSGGKGEGEDITEALAMKRYLIKNGIPEQSIITEEQATSTYENFAYSKVLLDGIFGEEYSSVFVTSDYHVCRAGAIADAVGLEGALHIHSSTPWYDIAPSAARECMAIIKTWLDL